MTDDFPSEMKAFYGAVHERWSRLDEANLNRVEGADQLVDQICHTYHSSPSQVWDEVAEFTYQADHGDELGAVIRAFFYPGGPGDQQEEDEAAESEGDPGSEDGPRGSYQLSNDAYGNSGGEDDPRGKWQA